ncbi:hypothetical protein Tdes44962_MAKER09903 [Teratosphaeria destructans]|uniref:Uncharacterized protein n=1 Tax=Teratosphaeria destructans TaxID=418781 RepID=A0A9W7SQU1_9PEZI|nr:hypothetical protein Tdes44962_MAKER09903 [Teratosphaeria destructans]
MHLGVLSLALATALLAHGHLPKGKPTKDECDSGFYAYAQCVYYDNPDDPRGTYNKDVTRKACAAYEHGDFPPFTFVEKDKACTDEIGIGHHKYRRLCNYDMAVVCGVAGGTPEGFVNGSDAGAYGSNAGETLEEMYSYADEG